MKRLLFLLILLALGAGGYFLWLQENTHIHEHDLILFGNVDIRQVELGFRVEGRVKQMFFEEGDTVKKGDLLALLDAQPYLDDLKRAKANVISAQSNLAYAESILNRRQSLIQPRAVSQESLDEAINQKNLQEAQLKVALANVGVAKTRLKDTLLYCPTDGSILTRIREPGTVLQPSSPIYAVSIPSPVWVRAYVTEPNLARITPGMPAQVITDTPGRPIYKGYVGFISPVAEFTPKTVETTDLRTDLVYRLRIIIEEPDEWLRQGMPVTVKLLEPMPKQESSTG